MDDNTTSSKSKVFISNDNSKTRNEISNSIFTLIMPILISNVDHILNTARIIDDRWLQDHNQKAISAEILKSSESTMVCSVTTDSKSSSDKPTIKRSRKIKKCRFSGCKLTEEDGVIIKQSGCPQHYDDVRLKNNAQRLKLFHEKKNHLPSNYMFDIGTSLHKNIKFIKCDSYYSKVLMKTSFTKGKMVGITSSFDSIFQSLMKNGYAFLPQAIDIEQHNYNSLVDMIEAKPPHKNQPWKFEKLFTTMTNTHKPKFILKGANRYVTSSKEYMNALANWIDLENKVVTLLGGCGFTTKSKKSRKKIQRKEFVLDFTMLKSDANLKSCQVLHNDIGVEFASVGKSEFDFIVIVGVEEYSFLDIRPDREDEEPMRVLIERGDMFLMRADIPHSGCDNLTDNTHYRIHMSCIRADMADNNETKSSFATRQSSRPFPPGPYFDISTGQFNYGRRIY